MNIVYYIVSSFIKDKNVGLSGGHGYSYDPGNESKRKLQKDVPSVYGYYVNGNYQNIAVDQIDIYNGRILKQPNEVDAYLTHLELIINKWLEDKKEGNKLLVIGNCVKAHKMLEKNKCPEAYNAELFNRVYALMQEHKKDIIHDIEYYAKGGEGPKTAHKQLELAEALSDLPNPDLIALDKMDVKEYKNPEIDFNKLVTATRWYFNTGDKSTFYDLDEEGYRHYTFGRVDPDKNYYGKATPDVFYSALYTKTPIKVLDKLFSFCQKNRPNPYNIMAAGNLNHIKSKEIARVIDTIPGTFGKKELVAPMTLGNNEGANLVEFIDPPGLSYRIRDFHAKLAAIFRFWRKRDANGCYQKHKFVDITELFFVKDPKGKWKIHPDFTNNTLKMPVTIEAPGCVKPVTINLSMKFDTPERNALNSLIVNKVEDIKVFLALDFSDDSGVSYCTIVNTPEFDYIHSNSIANLRVYSLKELGK
ncbi:putative ribonuclease H [Serratia phage vB_SmaM-Sureiya]|nr:putative ribonuclease H [Serratia phage vB_SmaM-Sureiya]